MGANETSDDYSAWLDDLLVVSFWATILVYALVTNILTVLGIARSRSMRGATSYWIVISLAVCDLFMINISLVHLLPATYLHETFVDVISVHNIWAIFAYNVFWYTGVVQLAAMAVNRFVSIVHPLWYKRVFCPSNTLLIIGALYLVGLLAAAPTLHPCCHTVYDHHDYVTYYVPENSGYMWVDIVINSLSVSTMCVCYAAILLRVRRSTVTRRRYQQNAARGYEAVSGGQTSGVVLIVSSSSGDDAKTTTELLNCYNHHGASDNNNKSGSGGGGGGGGARQQHRQQRTLSGRWTSVRRAAAGSPTSGRSAGANAARRAARCQQQASRREMRLFVQFFVVSLVFLSTWVTWQWLPRIPNASKWIYFATTTFFYINNAVNPSVYLAFNSGLRHQLRALICPHRRRPTASTTTMAEPATGCQATTRNNSSDNSNPNQSPGRNDQSHFDSSSELDFEQGQPIPPAEVGSRLLTCNSK